MSILESCYPIPFPHWNGGFSLGEFDHIITTPVTAIANWLKNSLYWTKMIQCNNEMSLKNQSHSATLLCNRSVTKTTLNLPFSVCKKWTLLAPSILTGR